MNNRNKITPSGGICAPAMVYLILSIIGLITAATIQFSVMSILLKVIFISLWTFLLNFLCSTGYTVVSWILVVLPIIFMIALIFIAIDVMRHVSKNDNKIHQNIIHKK
jgi:uncharacterized membrane protein